MTERISASTSSGRSLRHRLLDARDLRFEEGRRLDEVVDARAREPLHEDADPPVRELEHPHDDRDRADPVEILFARVLVLEVLLRGQHDHAVLGQRLIDRVDRFLSRDRERNDDERKDDQILERQNRQNVGDLDRLFFGGFVRFGHRSPLEFGAIQSRVRSRQQPRGSELGGRAAEADCAMAVPEGARRRGGLRPPGFHFARAEVRGARSAPLPVLVAELDQLRMSRVTAACGRLSQERCAPLD